MPRTTIEFAPHGPVTSRAALLLAGADRAMGPNASNVDPDGKLREAMDAAEFDGSASSSIEALALPGSSAKRVVVLGLGEAGDLDAGDWLKLGGVAASKLPKGDATIVLEAGGANVDAEAAAMVGLGLLMREYRFDRHKTKKKDDDEPKPRTVTIMVDDPDAARAAYEVEAAVATGIETARDLVNEPANILGTEEFKDRAAALADLGVEIEVLDEDAMGALGMGSLLSVSQGSERPAYLVAMRWNGGKEGEAPLALVGKGVVFDTGGISIKPGQGMGDMKGDMGGAAAVTGAMHAIAARKAKANVIGVIGLVENMPDGRASRPGDIVTSMSGQTIEILNTDAEGRLVLADALTWVQREHKPVAIIDLATLTGAILVALGQEHAGLFSNDDALSDGLAEAGEATGELVWRMPLGKAYDKLIDTKNADMKNIGGRFAGSITAAQFLQRFVEDGTPWAHLDIAGMAMNSPANEYSQSWASGYGVRLLDRLVRDHYEG